MGGAIGTVFFLVFVGVCGFIYWGIFYATKDKFENDEFKLKFLEEQFIHLKNTQEKNKKITNIFVSEPYRKNKPWKVSKTVKSGTWPLNDKEENIVIFSILDKDSFNRLKKYNFELIKIPSTISEDANFLRFIKYFSAKILDRAYLFIAKILLVSLLSESFRPL